MQEHLKKLSDLSDIHGPDLQVRRSPYSGDVAWVTMMLSEDYKERNVLHERHFENYLLKRFQLDILKVCLEMYRRIGLPPTWAELNPAQVTSVDSKPKFPYGRRNPGIYYMLAVLKLEGKQSYLNLDLNQVTTYCEAIVKIIPLERTRNAFFDWICRYPKSDPFYTKSSDTSFKKSRSRLEEEARRLHDSSFLEIDQ